MNFQRLLPSIFAIITLIALTSVSLSQEKQSRPLTQLDIFVSGTDNYHTYRIPALITTNSGTILAFCEGRKKGRSDTGNIDIVLKRSFDNGKLWQPMQVIWDDGANVCGNPCPVIDSESGTIYLLLTYNLGTDHEGEIMAGTSESSRTVWVMKSEDDGASWSEPEDITVTTKAPDWTWYATGPGVGIQTESGRLIIPCDHAMKDTKVYGSHVIYSDDHGESWQLGGAATPFCNECQVVELNDGGLLLNMRSYHKKNRRAISTSSNGGLTWSAPALDMTLIEPVCQASLIKYGSSYLFSNPADTRRVNMTIRLSNDNCGSWPVSKTLYEGPSAYSSLSVLADGSIACFYERGKKSAYEVITFAAFGEEWLGE